jgi:neutral ceramidase
MNSEYKCSFLKFDITPNVSADNPAYLQGFSGGLRASTSVAMPLSLELCMLVDSNHTKFLFVTADIIGFDQQVVSEIRSSASQWGIESEGIVLNASHTHYAPGTLSNMPDEMGPFYEKYSSQILQSIVSNLKRLYDCLEPCEISSGSSVAQIGVNRRLLKEGKINFAPNPEGAYVRDTPIVRIKLKNCRKTILWVAHGCHPTGMGSDNRISSDYPGFMKYELIRNRVADGVMFFQGAGGSSKEALYTNGKWTFCQNIKDVRQTGLNLAGSVAKAINAGMRKVDGNFFSKAQRVDLPLNMPEMADVQPKAMPSVPVDVQLVCLGDEVNMLTCPMEPVAELTERIMESCGFSSSDFILGYTNGLVGYLPTDDILDIGGYEAKQSHKVYRQPGALAAGTERRITDAVKRLRYEKQVSDLANGYGRYYRAKGPHKAFFVLSSGRCGTMTFAHLLNTADNARVWHHPQPFLIEETLQAYQDQIDKREVFWRSRATFIHRAWAQGLIHGETDHNMTPFVDMIAEQIPNSKFVVLVRDPRDFVRSGMRRNYYNGHPWDSGRLRPKKRDSVYEEWVAFDQFEKICWLWNKTYSEILERIKSIPENRLITVRFEDLLKDVTQIEKNFSFFGIGWF